MNNLFTQIFGPLRDIYSKLSSGNRIILILFLGIISGTLVLFAIWAQVPDYETLYSNLSAEDSGAIIEKLKEEKIPYKISSNGNSIQIPSSKIYEIRLQMANQGLPQGGGVGFEIFDRNDFGMTDFAQKMNYQRSLQGELTRTIKQLEEVEMARVHLVLPEKSLFVDEQEKATASVVLKLRPGKELRENQVQGIVHLVASSVERLSPENVTVIDIHGKILSKNQDNSLFGRLTSSQIDFQRNIEKNLETSIQSMLERVTGIGKVIARVSATLDFNQTEKTIESYDPDTTVLRSEQINQETSGGAGSSTTETAGGGGKKSGYQKTMETRNFEINKVISHEVKPLGEIKRISVAVLVDGNYQLGKDGKGEKKKYIPRSDTELKKYESIVKKTVGFNGERGDQVEVTNAPFENADFSEDIDLMKKEEWKELLYTGGKYTGYALAILLTFLFVIRPIMKWITTGNDGNEIRKMLPKTVQELENELRIPAQNRKAIEEGASTNDRVLDIVRNNPQIAGNVIKGWLKPRV